MITCASCGISNPMGTRWCRQCGTKLELNVQQVQAAVSATAEAASDDNLVTAGRNTLALGGFLLVTAFILRLAFVPDLPPVEAPLTLPDRIIPEVERAAAVASAGSGNTAIASRRLRWRATVCRPLANQLGLDLEAMDAARERISATQKADGTWPGEDPLAATGLAALALQAWPSDEGLGRATRARAWAATQLQDATRRTPLGRTLAIAALDDAEELGQAERNRLQAYLIDGKSPQLQAWMLAGTPPANQPPELGLVRDALKTDVWQWYFTVVTGGTPDLDAQRFYAETVGTVAAEDRPAWSTLAWTRLPAPADTATILQGWSRNPPPAASDPALAKAGTHVADALWLIALAAPSRLPAVAAR